MYRLIACDLDETLLDDDGKIPERVRAAIAAARERGAQFVVATGRPYVSVGGVLEELGLKGSAGEHVISFNGGVITDNAEMRPLTSCSLPRATADALYAYGVEHGLCMHVYALETVYIRNFWPEERAYVEGRMDIRETDDATLSFMGERPVVKLLFMSLDADKLRRAERELAERGLTQGLEVCYSSNRYLEFNAPGVNKGAGLLELARRLGVSQEETMAIGDNSNDVPMIAAAGLGVAVANATSEAKATAGYVCEADNNHGAVAEVIEKYVLQA